MECSKTTTTAPTYETLRRPVQIVKKHSGPLDEVLSEINKSETEAPTSVTNSPVNEYPHKTANIIAFQAPNPARRRSILKEKGKKRERWLLTRKTWRYMTDAGRKLIPEGIQNKQEDIPKIEEHFQNVCALEPYFVLWKRKYSYPGALRNSRRRLKQLLQHTGQKSQNLLKQEEVKNADILLELLQNHLNLDEAIKTDTLLGTKTEGPHQTYSPSAQRPKPLGRAVNKRDANFSIRGPGFLPSTTTTHLPEQNNSDQLLQRLLTLSRNRILPDAISIPPEHINEALLNDKATLKKLYYALKKQQLHRILSKHSMPPKTNTTLTHSMSMLSLFNFETSQACSNTNKLATHPSFNKSATAEATVIPLAESKIPRQEATVTTSPPRVPQRQRKPPTSLNLTDCATTSSTMRKAQHQRPNLPEKHFNSCGSQTNFIPLSEIKRLAEEYKEYKREELAADGGGNATTDDECDKQTALPANRRKSSIDNEDISQSVSDTIKRYLRMARKKSVHDDHGNRFKRVNYDRNLRNIQSKGEINPPGMDEHNHKAVQTLDAWALISLDFIRGEVKPALLEIAHNDWQKALDERLRRKSEYERKLNQSTAGVNHSTSSCSSSAPTSPLSNQSPTLTNMTSTSSINSTYDAKLTIENINAAAISNLVFGAANAENTSHSGGMFHSGSQFITNLWHGNTSPASLPSSTVTIAESNQLKQELLGGTSLNDDSDSSMNRVDVKKSKSLSHIGHFVSSKLLKGHSKNPAKLNELLPPVNATSTCGLPRWSRSGKNCWKSISGETIMLRDTPFHVLTESEIKMIKDICIERIIELDIGIERSDLSEVKFHKKHPMTKMRAMTTSFFDIGKKDSNNHNLSLFGNSLEDCVLSDKKNELSDLSAISDRGSRSSIVSLFRSSSRSGGNIKNTSQPDKLNENVRSCENFLIKSDANLTDLNRPVLPEGDAFETKFTYKNISLSHTDVRRYSSESPEDGNHLLGNTADVKMFKELNVPKFVKFCIQFLEDNGLHTVGLFRVSTSKKKIKQIRESFGKNFDKCLDEDTCPHNVATLLKEFLRDLPEPLLSNRLHKAFLRTQKIRNRRLQLEALSHLVKLLPPAHLDTLYVLLKFLAKVAAYSDDVCDKNGNLQLTGNRMDSSNLATVFAPNILRSTVNSKLSPGDHTQSSKEQDSIDDAINIIRIMIDHYEELFVVPADIMDIVFTHLLDVDPEQLNALCEYHRTTSQSCTQFYSN